MENKGNLMLSSRDPYPYPTLENDINFSGNYPKMRAPYNESIEAAQKQDPFQRLYKNKTLSSARHEVYHFDPRAPRDDLDYRLKTFYNPGEELFTDSNVAVRQPETCADDHGRVLKNRVKPEPKLELPLNHPLRVSEQKKKTSGDSLKLAITGHHSEMTNSGYSRKPDGGYFTT